MPEMVTWPVFLCLISHKGYLMRDTVILQARKQL